MSLTLRQTQATKQRLDLSGLLPETLAGVDEIEIRQRPLFVGKQRLALGELFEIETGSGPEDELVLIPANDRLDYVGAGMRNGRLRVRGTAGHHAGSGMLGGELLIEGDCGDFAGSGLRNGHLQILGDAGDRVGAPPAGERQGQRGGLIRIRGRVGERAGECQRRGLLLIEGDAGALLGHRMIAGSIYVGGQAGELAGHGMRRGSLLLRQRPPGLPSTLAYNGRQRLGFLPLLLGQLRQLSDQVPTAISAESEVERYLGDLACDGRGEILILD
jgi:formylmethanofuran dehydrogenase subunit C